MKNPFGDYIGSSKGWKYGNCARVAIDPTEVVFRAKDAVVIMRFCNIATHKGKKFDFSRIKLTLFG